MLREIESVSQKNRRWFQDLDMDLFTWSNGQGAIERFELTYDKPQDEKSLTWKSPDSFTHCSIDNGNDAGGFPETPIHGKEIHCDMPVLIGDFRNSASDIDEHVSEFIISRMKEFKVGALPEQVVTAAQPKPSWILLISIVGGLIALLLYWFAK